MRKFILEIPMIMVWIAIWGLIELAIERFAPAGTGRRILTYGGLLGLAVVGELVMRGEAFMGGSGGL